MIIKEASDMETHCDVCDKLIYLDEYGTPCDDESMNIEHECL